ncbi:MAG: NAD(P)H-dependent glycerol-3-phosphate dehydrogenase [Polyangiaceae bacterium]
MTKPVAVLGAGNWGTTLAHLIASNGCRVLLFTRDRTQCDEINRDRTNHRAGLDLRISPGVCAVTDLGDAVSETELLLIAVPSQSFRDVCRAAASVVRPEQLVIHCAKGLELETHRRMSEVLLEETCLRQIGVLAGPNIASEIAQGKPAGTTIASSFPRVVEAGRSALSSERFMVFAGTDVLGVELCGALKNVIAIAAGMADEMKVGENAKAFLVTRGVAELTRLAFAMGAQSATMTGLAGIGDVMVTCASPLSRNHLVGAALARGESLDRALAQLGMVAEGVYASRAAHELAAEHGIAMPLFEHVERMLRHGLSPRRALDELMSLTPGHDVPRLTAYPKRNPHRGPFG